MSSPQSLSHRLSLALLILILPCPAIAQERSANQRRDLPRVEHRGDPAPPPEGSPVPEPSALLLVGTGLVGVAWTTRNRRKRARAAE